jgi:hypothetical protein
MRHKQSSLKSASLSDFADSLGQFGLLRNNSPGWLRLIRRRDIVSSLFNDYEMMWRFA